MLKRHGRVRVGEREKGEFPRRGFDLVSIISRLTTTRQNYRHTMSDNSSPPRATGRGTTERRAALERLQDASKNKSRLEKGKRPTFLGAEDDEEGDTFDFEAFSRPKEKNRTRKERDSTEGPAARDSLGNGFDDLFNLDDPNASRTGDDNAQGGDLDDLDADAAPVKKKRVVAKMDETRLLGPTGFPKLIEDIKRVKLKGKGHEVSSTVLIRSS